MFEWPTHAIAIINGKTGGCLLPKPRDRKETSSMPKIRIFEPRSYTVRLDVFLKAGKVTKIFLYSIFCRIATIFFARI